MAEHYLLKAIIYINTPQYTAFMKYEYCDTRLFPGRRDCSWRRHGGGFFH